MTKKHFRFLAIMMIAVLQLWGCGGLAQVEPQEKVAVTLEPVSFTLAATSTPTFVPAVEPPAADLTPTPIAFVEVQAISSDSSTEAVPASSALEQNLASVTPLATIRQTMNIRSGPSTAYPVVGSAKPDETFTVLGRNEDSSWAQVAHPAVEQAWLYADLVELTGNMQVVPLIQGDDIPLPPPETETQPVISTTEEPRGTIYFVADKVEGLGYFDPAIGGGVDIKVDGVKDGIYKISPDGTNLTQIHPYLANGNHIAISPDGQKILYRVEAGHDLYLSNLDGSQPINLTNSPDLGEGWPVWLPDGQRIVYRQDYDSFKRLPSADNFSDVYVLDVNQATPLNLTHHPPGRSVGSYAVSPNGQQVVFISGPSQSLEPPPPGMDFVPDPPETLSVINLDGSGRLDLLDNPSGYELGNISWSPDGQHIALRVSIFQRAVDGYEYYNSDVHLLNADGTQQVNITNTPDANESYPVWSPDGQQLAVTCDYDKGGVYSKGETTGIQFFSRDGTAQTACIDLPNTYSAADLKWSPDGQRAAIFSGRIFVEGKLLSTPQTTLFTIKADGTDLSQITDSGLDVGYDFAWSPERQWLAFSAKPRIFSITGMFTSAEEAKAVIEHRIYVSQADSSRIIPLTEGNFWHITQIEWQP